MKTPKYINVDGLLLPPSFDPDVFRSALKYKPEKDDVIVATYPKCGTTWTLQIVTLILREGKPPTTAEEYFKSNLFLEMTEVEKLEHKEENCVIKTHMPFDRINFSPEAKYIYVARRPADCVVSFYHHVRYFPIYCFSDGKFDDFFETFIKGGMDFGDYFDHVISWYEHRDEPNIMFITYEEMKKDPKAAVLEIAKFLGKEYHDRLLADGGKLLDKVLEYSSFDFMKQTTDTFWNEVFTSPEEAGKQSIVMKNYAKLMKEATEMGHLPVGSFVRKGEVGEGKILLSEEQKCKLESRSKEKSQNFDVMSLWHKP